jgi:cellulose synthase operon protein C
MAVRTNRQGRKRAGALAAIAAFAVALSSTALAEQKRSVRDRIGAERAIELLASSSRDERLRGIAQLNAQLNTPFAKVSGTKAANAAKKRRNHAKQALVAALKEKGQAKTAVERLAVVRALADWAHEAAVMQALTEFGLHARSVRSPDLAMQVRGTAALALARSGEIDAYKQLGTQLIAGDATGSLIAEALIVYPPKDPDWVLAGARRPTVPFLRVLATRDTPATRKLLRKTVKEPRASVRAKAALVLDDFGDAETKGLATVWLERGSAPVLQLAGFEILCRHNPTAAAKHLPRLLNRVVTGRAAIEISRRCGALALTQPLVAALARDEDPEWVAAVLRALGAIGGREATQVVVAQFSSETMGALAADALANNDGGTATTAVMREAMRDNKTRRNATRAVLGAWIQSGMPQEKEPEGLRPALEGLLAARSDTIHMAQKGREAQTPHAIQAVQATQAADDYARQVELTKDDNALGAWGLAILDEARGRQLLASKDPIVVAGAARGWLDAGRDGAGLAERAAGQTNLTTRRAFALSLLDIKNAHQIPTSILVTWVESDPSLKPLAARALAARDDAHARSVVASLLNSADKHVQSHLADGLGYATHPDAVSRLRRLYMNGNAAVRLAAIRALARRDESAGKPTLVLAAHYDIDRRVRDTARVAVGQPITPVAVRGAAPATSSEPAEPGAGATQYRRFFSHVTRVEDSFDTLREPLLVADDTGLLRPLSPAEDGWVGFVGVRAATQRDNNHSPRLEIVVPPPSSEEVDKARERDPSAVSAPRDARTPDTGRP